MRLFTAAVFLVTAFSLFACGDGSSSSVNSNAGTSTGNNTSSNYPSSFTASNLELSAGEFEALSVADKYEIINKLKGALYKGTAAADFFDLTNGLEPLVMNNSAQGIADVKSALRHPMADKRAVLARIDDKYIFQDQARPMQYPLAMLYEFPISWDYFAVWMAYRLSNTILFSPALELETCDYTDIQKVFQRLVSMIENGDSIQDIVYEHMTSQENWRRFRSPEDNTREMMEIFLARFMDEEVPLASLACRNWSLTDKPEGYQLVVGFDENTEPQEILDTTVTTCTEFYHAVAGHADLIPRITSILVDLFLTDAPSEVRQRVVDTIVSENPVAFQDIFIPILFSREFLMDTERPGHLEERFFNIAHRISWWANAYFFKYMNYAYSSSSYPSLKNMRQAAFTYKLGRTAEVPLDTLSFSYFHKSIRERLLLDRKKDPLNINDGGWQMDFIDVQLENDDFIKYIFLAVISRLPTEVELTTLRQIIEDRGYTLEKHSVHRAMIIMDYLSRLSETYYVNALD